MIELLITMGAVAESRTLFGPEYGYELPAQGAELSAPPKPMASKPWLLPNLRFDDSQDCLTFLKKQLEGFGTLRISHRCSEPTEQPVPWRSL